MLPSQPNRTTRTPGGSVCRWRGPLFAARLRGKQRRINAPLVDYGLLRSSNFAVKSSIDPFAYTDKASYHLSCIGKLQGT